MIGRTLTLAVSAALVIGLAPAESRAYEAATTHAGLTEQAASHSKLHQRIREQFGLSNGLFQPLIVPPQDAVALFRLLRRYNPTHGYVPDGRGRQSALAWLVAGSVLADSPSSHSANHYFDPLTGLGLSDATVRGADSVIRVSLEERLAGDRVRRSGRPAPQWITARDNPMGLVGFLSQYGKAVRAPTPAERARHLAGALLSAGAVLHVLQDMGSPSHVRNDLAAHLDRIGKGRLDVGSRFERVAALAYGRLGVPAPSGPAISRDSVQDFFSAADHGGLADRTHAQWFSAHTLPRTLALRGRLPKPRLGALLRRAVRRPGPQPLPSLDLFSASKHPVALTDANGTCLAHYQLSNGKLSWTLDDRCILEQLAALLPEVASYSTGLLDYLFRGKLVVMQRADSVTVAAGGVAIGSGKLELFWDDPRGVRTRYAEAEVKGAELGKALAKAAAPPKQAVAVVALFQGRDKAGQPLAATGHKRLGK